MERRRFIAGSLGLLAAPLAAEAQSAGQALPRIGFLGNGNPTGGTQMVEALRQGLRDLGWIEGQTVVIDDRWAEGQFERLPALAAELVRLRSDVIVAAGTQGVLAAKQATSSIPIVIGALLVDPVRFGYVASLAHPGGNITGLASEYEAIVTKQLQLLSEAVPRLARLVVLRYTAGPAAETLTAAVGAAADTLGLRARVLGVKEAAELEGAFRRAHDENAQALHVLPSPFFDTHRRLLTQLAARC